MAEVQDAPETTSRKKTDYIKVDMADGRQVEFATTIKAKKAIIAADGNEASDPAAVAGVRFDFVNGQTRTIMLASMEPLLLRLAAHGISQKGGDSYASEKDVDDAVEALDDTLKTLGEGKWSEGRTGGFGGVSILVKALANVYGKDHDTVRAILKDMTPKEKAQLKQADGIREEVQKLEAEKAASSGVDVTALTAKFA